MLIRINTFFKTTILGGVIVILPAVILILAFKWLFGMVNGAISPLTNLVLNNLTLPASYDNTIATIIVLLVIVLACFMFGLFVRTKLGQLIYSAFENSFLSRAPGYRMIKETVTQLLGKKKSPFSSVALAQIFENGTMATAFVTEEHENGMVTVFVPTGPNPTSGFIYHLDAKLVHRVDVSVEEAMRSVISCGAGSSKLTQKLMEKSASTED